MDHQDWNTVVIRKKVAVEKKKPNVRKDGTSGNKKDNNDYFRAIDQATDVKVVPKVGLGFGKQMQQARIGKNLSQKDLASRLNVRVDVVRNFENGKGNSDNRLKQKIETILGFRFVK